VGAAVAWFAHLNLAYVLVPFSCAVGGPALLYVATVLLAGVALASGAVSWMNWRRMTEEERGTLVGEMEGTRQGFMVYSGLLASGVFLLAILLATLPMLFLNPCTMEGRI
jgi:hypothetical protein